MKLKKIVFFYASIASLAAPWMRAQEIPATPRSPADSTQASMDRTRQLGGAMRASELIGMEVENRQDEKLGKVENVMLDLAAGRIVAVIISSGGFLGMGDELSAIPTTALAHNDKRDGLVLDATKESLRNAPHFKSGEWPDLNDAGYVEKVYHAYRTEPYFDSKNRSEPDNTARNVRDRNSRTLTPLDQGNDKADIATTAKIRKQIVAAKEMSVNARNVKIITAGGRVTLRGPVATEAEKTMIGEIAASVARTENVDNQLEVK
jgi:sporulation protein YlmC with PRC-barrel domain